MSSLVDNIKKVKDAFAAIKTALTGKGVTVPEDAKLSDVPALVEDCGKKPLCTFEITNSDGTKIVETTSEGVVRLRCRFKSATSFRSISVVLNRNSSVVFDAHASHMFYDCSKLTSITLPSVFGASITDADGMFCDCSKLTSITLPSGFGASITDAMYMFNCGSLTSLTLPSGFGASITKPYSMFGSSLTSLTLPSGFGASITSGYGMFVSCRKLTQILAPEGVTLADDGSNGILRMRTSFDLSPTALDKDSLIRVIKSLQTVTSATLTLGTALKAKLEGDDNADGAAALALAASKGWTIA